jgi:ABC-type multidrug transport system fused ATPase/permease subunit
MTAVCLKAEWGVRKLRARKEWRFFSLLPRADRRLGRLWYGLLVVRSVLPAGFAVATGVLVSAVNRHASLVGPLVAMGAVFVLMQIVNPLHSALSANLGDRAAAYLYDRLTDSCVNPPGMAHLDDPELSADLQVARDFDTGMTGPPLRTALDFVASGLVDMGSGLASVVLLFGYAWWAPLLLGGAWGSTHWLLKESGVWRDRNTEEVRSAQRDADYAYRLAVDPPAAKELRMFGLAGWTIERFLTRRRLLHQIQYRATRMRERSVLGSLVLVGVANGVVFWELAASTIGGHLGFGSLVVYAQAAVGASTIAFGGLNWALDGASSPVAAVERLAPAMAAKGAMVSGTRSAAGHPASEIVFRGVTFAYPAAPTVPILEGFDLTIPAASSMAIVGLNGAGKTTLAKLLCRLYDAQQGVIEVDGIDIRDFDLDSWRSRVTAVFQDFIRFELPLRDNIAPLGSPDSVIAAALAGAGADGLAGMDTILSKAYAGGTDLSGGQWQRVALARALAAVSLGAGVVLLDEPTAQLDVRGEAEIFDRILAATRQLTTILISHRFSTVRHADRICVIESGRVVELGSHAELVENRGRYRAMFDVQARRFASGLAAEEGEEEIVFDAL